MREARHARKNRRSSRKPVGDHTGTRLRQHGSLGHPMYGGWVVVDHEEAGHSGASRKVGADEGRAGRSGTLSYDLWHPYARRPDLRAVSAWRRDQCYLELERCTPRLGTSELHLLLPVPLRGEVARLPGHRVRAVVERVAANVAPILDGLGDPAHDVRPIVDRTELERLQIIIPNAQHDRAAPGAHLRMDGRRYPDAPYMSRLSYGALASASRPSAHRRRLGGLLLESSSCGCTDHAVRVRQQIRANEQTVARPQGNLDRADSSWSALGCTGTDNNPVPPQPVVGGGP